MPTDNKGYLGTREEFKEKLVKDALEAIGEEYPPKDLTEKEEKPKLRVVK